MSTYKAQAGDKVIVHYNNQDLDAIVKAVQSTGKIDCVIDTRGKYFGSTVVFGPGDVRPADGDEGADDVHQFHGSESYAEMAKRVEGDLAPRPAAAAPDLSAVHNHLDDATSNLRADLTAALDAASETIRAHFSSALAALVDRIEALEAKIAAPPAAPAAPAAPTETKES